MTVISAEYSVDFFDSRYLTLYPLFTTGIPVPHRGLDDVYEFIWDADHSCWDMVPF